MVGVPNTSRMRASWLWLKMSKIGILVSIFFSFSNCRKGGEGEQGLEGG